MTTTDDMPTAHDDLSVEIALSDASLADAVSTLILSIQCGECGLELGL